MKLGVIADTHSKKIPKEIFEDFADVDLIVHAGDFCEVDVYEQFKKIKETKAVYGNMDESGLRSILPETDIFQVEDVKIGLYHGDGPPNKVPKVVYERFKNDKVNLIIFGHSHQPYNEYYKDILLFNPGSATDTIFAPYCSYGILKINNDEIEASIKKVKASDDHG